MVIEPKLVWSIWGFMLHLTTPHLHSDSVAKICLNNNKKRRPYNEAAYWRNKGKRNPWLWFGHPPLSGPILFGVNNIIPSGMTQFNGLGHECYKIFNDGRLVRPKI
jgi:hypothetical protein